MSNGFLHLVDTQLKEMLQANKDAGASDDLSNVVVCKTGAAGEPVDAGPLSLEWIISTATVDRSGDTIDPGGWDFANWIKGGSILYGHDPHPPNLPVARPDKERPVWVEDGKVKSIAVYPERDLYPFGYTVYEMSKAHFIRGASVGFIPREWKEVTDRPGWMPLDFLRQELLEWSHTPIPDNPEALQSAKQLGIDLAPLKSWVSERLDAQTFPLFVTRDQLEKTHSVLRTACHVDLGGNSVSQEKAAISYESAHAEGTPVADREADWDGPAQIEAADAESLRVMCAWVDTEDADNKGAYKLPHHKADDKALVWRGLTAAMAALLGARGGVDIPEDDKAAVYNHLARHYRDDFDEDPPEFNTASVEPEATKQDDDGMPQPGDSGSDDDTMRADIDRLTDAVEGLAQRISALESGAAASTDGKNHAADNSHLQAIPVGDLPTVVRQALGSPTIQAALAKFYSAGGF